MGRRTPMLHLGRIPDDVIRVTFIRKKHPTVVKKCVLSFKSIRETFCAIHAKLVVLQLSGISYM